jgi:hypothetical protein
LTPFCLLLFASSTTDKPLVLVVEKDGITITEMKLELSISSVEKMFRHLNLCYVAGEDNTVVSRSTAPNMPDSQTNGKNFVFLHGYNVDQEQARGWAAEIFKKMWWSGSRAKFYAVTWRGAHSQLVDTVTINYHINVEHAFATASSLANFINNLQGEVTTSAHSLGNMVVLGALNLPQNPAWIARHFAFDAAVAAEALDGSLPYRPGMAHSDWDSSTGTAADANKIDETLWASEWYRLFSTSDARSKLTWRDKLAANNGAIICNFYSAGASGSFLNGEEVLNYTEAKPTVSIYSSSATAAGLGAATGELAWWDQELFKGRLAINSFVGSNYGGWGFGPAYWTSNIAGTFPPTRSAISGMNWTDDKKRNEPLFLFGTDKRLKDYFWQAYADQDPVADLYGPNGSSFADRHHITLLADMIPARTVPMGREAINALNGASGSNNFDLSSTLFRTSMNDWPQERLDDDKKNTRWLHSDARDVPYRYNSKLFDKWVELGALKSK